MTKIKIAMLFPYAPAYRELIYRKMDEVFDVDWFFCGNAKRPLKLLDYSILRNVNLTMSEKTIIGPLHYYQGVKKLQLEKYDAIIAAPVTRCLSMWWLVRKFGRKTSKKCPKVFFWTHGWYGHENFLESFLKKIMLRKTDGFLLYNNRAKQLMVKEGFEESRLFVIYNSLNYDEQLLLRESLSASDLYQNHFGNNAKNIVFIGRLTKEKRFDLLIDAVAELKENGMEVNVTFIGDGEDRSTMEQRVKELGIENQVWFYGACYDERTNAELIYNADLCVSPGNIGLTAIHVLMFGCPAITCDDYLHQGPEFEAIHEGITGGFFIAGDVESLANSISQWFKVHGNDREQIRRNCFHEIDNYWTPQYQIEVLHKALDD